ncbi:MAG: hypothetical protein PHR18_04230 [Oscillospiraceae bacterium]|nr:hypothetical protein [Oscillospiraceae bacterium]
MSYEINRIKDIELIITELQIELEVLKEISVMIPENEREHIIQLYLTGSSLTDIYEDFKNRDYRPCGLYPTTKNLLSNVQ